MNMNTSRQDIGVTIGDVSGHDPGIVYDPGSDAFSELGGSGIALGVDAEWIYQAIRKLIFQMVKLFF